MNALNDKKIAVLLGGLSKERDISLVTGNAVLEALTRKGLTAVALDVQRDIAEKLRKEAPDIAFNALHGNFGEDGTIQGILEYQGIPYTGSGVLGSSVAYNKVATKRIFLEQGIPTATHEVFLKKDYPGQTRTLSLPVVVKPSDQGSSLGISIVKEESEWEPALKEAFSMSDEILVEEFIEGQLLAIGMRGDQPLPIVHIRPKSGFYDYEAKYTSGKTEYICPADLSNSTTKRCQNTAVRVFHCLKARGFPRVDVILDKNETPYVLEMNTVPGMTATSLLPMAAREAGIEFDDLVIEILQSAGLDYEGGDA